MTDSPTADNRVTASVWKRYLWAQSNLRAAPVGKTVEKVIVIYAENTLLHEKPEL